MFRGLGPDPRDWVSGHTSLITTVVVRTPCTCTQVGMFGDPGRDPRGWVVSAAYAAVVPTTELGVKAAVGGRGSACTPQWWGWGSGGGGGLVRIDIDV